MKKNILAISTCLALAISTTATAAPNALTEAMTNADGTLSDTGLVASGVGVAAVIGAVISNNRDTGGSEENGGGEEGGGTTVTVTVTTTN